MKQWRFEVFNRPGSADVHGSSILEDIRELGINSVEAVQSAKVFLIEADPSTALSTGRLSAGAGFDKNSAKRLGKELLTDPVCEEY